MSITNRLGYEVSGGLEFDLPSGITAKPEQPSFGPIGKGGKAEVHVIFAAGPDSSEGKRIIPVRAHYRRTKDAADTWTQHVALQASIGTSVVPDDRRPGNTHLTVEAPLYSADIDMRNSCLLHLSDPDGVTRLSGSPLFTFTDENGKPVVSPETFSENIWFGSRSMTVICSNHYIVMFEEDRIVVPRWRGPQQIRLKEARFTIPRRWVSAGGTPRWKRIVAVDGQGDETDVQPARSIRLVAAELEFPQSNWNLAFQFNPPQDAVIDGTGMQFTIRPLDETVAIGFCRPGTLDQWRRK